jgi:LysM repeat protein
MKFRVGSLISSNPEKQTVFQVDTSGTKLTVTERGGKSTSVIVGKMGPSFSEVYFRLPASKDVYLGEGLDTWMINKEARDWRDKTILIAPSETIRDLTYSVGNKLYEFHRDSTVWKAGGKAVDVSVINPALTSLSNLHADDFVDAPASIQSHPATVKVHASDDVTLTFIPVLPDSSKYYVQKSSSNQTFLVSKWTAQQILKPVEQHAVSSKPVEAVAEIPKEEPPSTSIAPQVTPKKEVAKKIESPVASPKKEPKTKPVERAALQKKEPVGKANEETLTGNQDKPAAVKEPVKNPKVTKPTTTQSASSADDEGDLTVHTVVRGETMRTIAQKYNVSVEQILKWNLLKTIAVRPGQELYIYVRK